MSDPQTPIGQDDPIPTDEEPIEEGAGVDDDEEEGEGPDPEDDD